MEAPILVIWRKWHTRFVKSEVILQVQVLLWPPGLSPWLTSVRVKRHELTVWVSSYLFSVSIKAMHDLRKIGDVSSNLTPRSSSDNTRYISMRIQWVPHTSDPSNSTNIFVWLIGETILIASVAQGQSFRLLTGESGFRNSSEAPFLRR